ncbi:MAG TPA: BBP7 family outer membrane beta-barrel protein [Pirellulales bacterium]|nr:BBP7 family outer membrane beta-barrel protein [Pirellulales bacterium]
MIDGADGKSEFQEALASDWCDTGDCNSNTGGGRWFGAVGGLVMARNRPNAYTTTFETNVNQPVLNTQSAGADWTGGWQVNLGYLFGTGGCGCANSLGPYGPCGTGGCGFTGPGIGFSYWGLGNMGGFAQANSPTNELNSTFTLLDPSTGSGQVEIGGQPFSTFFDNSASQRISRDNGTSNYELNLFFGAFNHCRWTVMPFVGFRYFHYDERLIFSGLESGSTWGANGGQNQAQLSFRTINNLYGLQLGTYANYRISGRCSWYIGPKVGLFGNQMSGRSLLARGDGLVGFDVNSHKSDFSLLGEVDTGLTWFVGPRFMTYLGYRVLGVANVALADNQFVQGIGDVKQSGSLILHGVMVGGGWTF